MKYLALCVLLCSYAALINGSCYMKFVEPDSAYCQDDVDGTSHRVGETWRNSECMDCSCGQCCTSYLTPKSIPDDCMSVFDKKACKYRTHKILDPSMPCPIYGAVGK